MTAAIPTVTPLSTPLPARTMAEAAFAPAADLFVQEFAARLLQLQTTIAAMNVAVTDTNASAALAAAGSSFRGPWTGLIGAINMPASVSHNGELWTLLANLGDVTAAVPGISGYWQPIFAQRVNRIINGCMRVDQRNGGAAITPTALAYVLDRWAFLPSVASKLTFQQVADAPVGAKYSLKATVAAQYAPGAADYFLLYQPIEGLNAIDFSLGTASATSICISFQVKSSITGSYPVSVCNSAGNRVYVSSYPIPVANVWTPIWVTIPGDLIGAWLTDAGIGLNLRFDLGSGVNANTLPAAWQAANFTRTAADRTFVNQVNGSTWQLAQVQVTPGAVLTPFERRPIGTELRLCQRYFETLALTTSNGSGFSASTTASFITFGIAPKRVAPTVGFSGALNIYSNIVAAVTTISAVAYPPNANTVLLQINCAGGLTAGYGAVANTGTAASINFSAEL